MQSVKTDYCIRVRLQNTYWYVATVECENVCIILRCFYGQFNFESDWIYDYFDYQQTYLETKVLKYDDTIFCYLLRPMIA